MRPLPTRSIKMNKLGVLMLAIAAFGVILLPQSGKAEMDPLTDEEMEEQLLYSPDFYFPLESEPGGAFSERDDELEDTEDEKLEKHLQAKTISETLTQEPEPEVSQLEEYKRVEPSGHIAIRSGRTMTIEEPSINIGRHDTPPNRLNPNTP